MEVFFFVLALFVNVALSKEVHGGPTQPPLHADSRMLNPALQEVSPKILDVIVRKGDPFIEVYIKALGQLSCYDEREYEVTRQYNKTIIVPRLKRSRPGTPCELRLEEFEDKIADLDPNLESAYSLEVLGYTGWYRKELPKP
jgi:hypothetical protein